MSTPWDPGLAGVVVFPSGRRVRGRGLREPAAGPRPDLGLYLLPRPPAGIGWEVRWLRWRDFGLPADAAQLATVLREVWERSSAERVEVACRGGTGRTGTALACLAVVDGVPADEAVDFVREHYRRRAVETPAQRALVERFTP